MRDDGVAAALREGAFRSLRACSLPANDPLAVRIWRRWHWQIIALGLFLLIDLFVLSGLGGIGGHF